MNVEQLETFLDLLESRNFNHTSDRLGLAQSSVSARIRALETSLGATLFERGRRGATPTPAGLRFEEHARLLLASWYQARRDLSTVSGDNAPLRISGQISLLRTVLVNWVTQLQDIEAIDVQADYSTQIVRDLLTGTLDIGLLYAPRYLPDLVVRHVSDEPFLMVSSSAQDLSQVKVEDYINTGYTDFFSRAHVELLPHLSFSRLNVGNEELALELLHRTGGSLYLPASLARVLCREKTSLTIVKNAPVISQPVYSAVHVRRQFDSRIIDALAALDKVVSVDELLEKRDNKGQANIN